MRTLALCMLACCGARSELDGPVDAAAPIDASIDHGHDVTPKDASVSFEPCTPPSSPTPVLLASGIGATYDTQLAVDDSSVYMADTEHITRFSKCKPNVKLTLTGYEPNSGRVLVDAGTVYFLDIVLGGSVRSVPIDGGIVTTIATASGGLQPQGLAKLGNTLFYVLLGPNANGPGVYSVPINGGTPFFIGTASGSALGVDSTSVYFFLSNALRSRPIGGGAATMLASASYDGAIAVDATTVYFTGLNAGTGWVASIPKQGGTVATLAPTEWLPVYATLDPPYLYWTDSQVSVKRILETGGTSSVLFSGNVAGITVDATSLYYSTYAGELWRVDK